LGELLASSKTNSGGAAGDNGDCAGSEGIVSHQ
jgi:hypothetical protein